MYLSYTTNAGFRAVYTTTNMTNATTSIVDAKPPSLVEDELRGTADTDKSLSRDVSTISAVAVAFIWSAICALDAAVVPWRMYEIMTEPCAKPSSVANDGSMFVPLK